MGGVRARAGGCRWTGDVPLREAGAEASGRVGRGKIRKRDSPGQFRGFRSQEPDARGWYWRWPVWWGRLGLVQDQAWGS